MSDARTIYDYRAVVEEAMRRCGDTSQTIDDIAAGIADGTYQMWPGERSVIVTQVVKHPRDTVLYIYIAGGDLREIEALSPPIIAWGRTQGCRRMLVIGRRGWARTFLTQTGWQKKDLVVLEREL